MQIATKRLLNTGLSQSDVQFAALIWSEHITSESAAKGDALGAFNLARCYENATGALQRFKFLCQRQSVHDALGTETDIAKALQYYKISAKRGWADAYVM